MVKLVKLVKSYSYTFFQNKLQLFFFLYLSIACESIQPKIFIGIKIRWELLQSCISNFDGPFWNHVLEVWIIITKKYLLNLLSNKKSNKKP
jgi:hypothetical protein